MAVASPISLTWASTLPKQNSTVTTSRYTASHHTYSVKACSTEASLTGEAANSRRRQILLGVGALATNLFPTNFVSAEEVPANYRAFVDSQDGYSYYYPSDWRDFDYIGHDSAFKDRYLALQNVRVSFIPTNKSDIHELGPMEEVIYDLIKHKLAAPTQMVSIYDMQERSADGKNYYTFEYELTSTNFSRTAFATIAIANGMDSTISILIVRPESEFDIVFETGRYYTLIVGANERRWKRFRDKLKVVADSFKVLDI